jgi:hypothetical protein
MMDELKLIERLRLIEALFAGASTEGERVAAERARERILERLASMVREEPPIEYKFTLGDHYSRRLLLALCRRYGLTPYRYSGQRHTTVMVRVSKRFVDETLWPEFQELSQTLRNYLSEVTDRVVAQVLHEDHSEATVIEEGGQLPSPAKVPPPPPVAPVKAETASAPAPSPSGAFGPTTAHTAGSGAEQHPDNSSRRKKRREKKRKKKRRRR